MKTTQPTVKVEIINGQRVEVKQYPSKPIKATAIRPKPSKPYTRLKTSY